MASDERVDLLWSAKCAVKLSLGGGGVAAATTDPGPVYALVPRVGYLLLGMQAQIQHFRKIAEKRTGSESVGEMRIETESGELVKWHLPMGVLADMLCTTANNSNGYMSLVVHFGPLPAKAAVLRYEDNALNGDRVFEAHYFNTLKQALFLKHGSTRLIMDLPKAEQESIWTAVRVHDSKQFTRVISDKLYANAPDSKAPSTWRAVPVRLICWKEGSDGNQPGSCELIQTRVTPSNGDGEMVSLGDAIGALESLVPVSWSSFKETCRKYTVAGVVVSLDAPLADVYTALVYPDQYLYICRLRGCN